MSSKISITRMRRTNRQLRKDVRLLQSDEQHLTIELLELAKKHELLHAQFSNACDAIDRNQKLMTLVMNFLIDVNSEKIEASG